MKEKSYKRIILHAGLHKTGSTSIQDNCLKHRRELLRNGIVYPGLRLGGRIYGNHSDPLAAALTSKMRVYGAKLRMRKFGDPEQAGKVMLEQLVEVMEKPQADTLLLSAELVCDFNERDTRTLRRFLEQYTEQLDVIALVRSPYHSLASIVQQRCRDGEASNPARFKRLVGERYQRLRDGFGDKLRVLNFHVAVEHPQGLVGYFLQDIGLSEDVIADFSFDNSNERVSMEAFRLMDAINKAYPREKQDEHGVQRPLRDLSCLNALPGQPFSLDQPLDDTMAEVLEEQRLWLQRELEFELPGVPVTASDVPLWQVDTLRVLESALKGLEDIQLRRVAAEALVQEADGLGEERADTAAVMRFIAGNVLAAPDRSTEAILRALGPDYFRHAALQVESNAMELSLLLMELALELRPEGEFIAERVQLYRNKLGKPGA